jgi:hypothetical protein
MNDSLIAARSRVPGNPVFAAVAALTRAAALHHPLDEELRTHLEPGSRAWDVAEVVLRGAQGPASSLDPGWAAELRQEVWLEALDRMTPVSILASLPLHRVAFNGAGKVTVPARKPDAAKNLAATWRLEGTPIRVGSLALEAKAMHPYSLGVIGSYSLELLRHSNVEQMIETAMSRDTARALDAAFLDDEPATAERPAGLQTYATGGNTRPASGSDVASITADLKACATAMVDGGCGARPTWAMSVLTVQSLMVLRDPTGALAFPTLSADPPQLLLYPVEYSTTAPRDVVFLVDADEIVLAGDAPKVAVTEAAVLHEEDAEPLPIIAGTQATPVEAVPTRSLFQTACGATRMVWDADWTVLADGAVQTITGTDAWL